MKSFSLPIALSAILLAQTAPAMADTFLYGSYCVGPGCPLIPSTLNSPTVFGGYSTTELTSAGATTVPSGAAQTFFADPSTVWTPPGPFASPYSNWVSWQPGTGPGNFTNTSPAGFYNYYSTFTLTNLGTDPDPNRFVGFLDVAADDTTSVWLNGFLLAPEGALGNDPICAEGLPNCRVHLGLFVYQYELQQGTNVFAFSVQQNALYTGLNYDASFTITPEPATLFLLATGLTAFATMPWGRKRRSSRDASGRWPTIQSSQHIGCPTQTFR